MNGIGHRSSGLWHTSCEGSHPICRKERPVTRIPTARGGMIPLTNSEHASRLLPVAEPARQMRQTLATLRIGTSAGELLVPPPAGILSRFKEVNRISKANRLPVQFLGYRPLFRGSLVYQGRTSDWAIMNLADDPFFRENGRLLYAPRRVIRDIERFDNLGLTFDAVFIAHELPKGSVRPGEPVPFNLLAPPPPANIERRLALLEKSSLSVWNWIVRLVGATAKVSAAAAVGVTAAAARDPILFGVHVDMTWHVDRQPIGMWYYLTHWYWSEDEQGR
jgi:hypothetical protein